MDVILRVFFSFFFIPSTWDIYRMRPKLNTTVYLQNKSSTRRGMMKYYVSHCASHHAIKGRLNIAVRGFIRSKFNLHSAFKQELAQPCMGKLSGMLRDLIYGSLSTRSDPVFTQSHETFDLWHVISDSAEAVCIEVIKLLLVLCSFTENRARPGLWYIWCILSTLKYLTTRETFCETFYSLLPPRCISLTAGRRDIKGKNICMLQFDITTIVNAKNNKNLIRISFFDMSYQEKKQLIELSAHIYLIIN